MNAYSMASACQVLTAAEKKKTIEELYTHLQTEVRDRLFSDAI